MKDYLAKSGRAAMPDQKKLLGVLKAQKVLLYAPLLKWYHEHGLEITAVHRTIVYFSQQNLQLVRARSSQHGKERRR